MTKPPLPQIIQGGMGVSVSTWRLARAVSLTGQLGVVSGTALAVILARRLQSGDPGGHMRRALARFPLQQIAQPVIDRYFVENGKPQDRPFKPVGVPTVQPNHNLDDLTVLANFAEVYLAKENHAGLVGINYLEKVQLPTLASLFGAMLAGVDYVLMGAGIPRAIPGILDRLAEWQIAELKVYVAGSRPDQQATCSFDPARFALPSRQKLTRPQFLAIVSSTTLAATLARRSDGQVNGFVIEGLSAGGHNAPPRGPMRLGESGEPVYGPRDVVDLEEFRKLGLPFWLAGSYAEPARLAAARAAGAVGVQIGTAFAFCDESGIEPSLKRSVLQSIRAGEARVRTEPHASPTGFPFKVLQLPGSLSDPQTYSQRTRTCDVGYLRQPYRSPDGGIVYRCPAEPLEQFIRKGGDPADTPNRMCLCNGLLATAGLAQPVADSASEAPLVTAGEDVAHLARFMNGRGDCYSAADVVRYVLGQS